MARVMGTPHSGPRQSMRADELLLRETNHRCSNDLQLIVGLLEYQSRHATSPEARDALADATSRVAVLARARAELGHQRHSSLQTALRQVCEALSSHAEPRSILLSLDVVRDVQSFTPEQVAVLALIVNELATNAIKHAFEEGQAGRISISVRQKDRHGIVIVVDDDGRPLPTARTTGKGGLGIGLIRRLVASIDGRLIAPEQGSKRFEIRVPVNAR